MNNVRQDDGKLVGMPSDASVNIDAVALHWLSKYDIEMGEVVDNNMLWSAKQQQLIFPCYQNAEKQEGLKAWQARNFMKDAKSRYFKAGLFHNFLHILNLYEGKGDEIVVVEDLISAIKVGRRYSTLCLFGSNLGAIQMKDLRNLAEHLIFWLDEDKADKGFKLTTASTQFGFKSRLLITKHDPKEYTNAQIQDIIGV